MAPSINTRPPCLKPENSTADYFYVFVWGFFGGGALNTKVVFMKRLGCYAGVPTHCCTFPTCHFGWLLQDLKSTKQYAEPCSFLLEYTNRSVSIKSVAVKTNIKKLELRFSVGVLKRKIKLKSSHLCSFKCSICTPLLQSGMSSRCGVLFFTKCLLSHNFLLCNYQRARGQIIAKWLSETGGVVPASKFCRQKY